VLLVDSTAGAAKIVQELAEHNAAGAIVIQAAGGIGLMRSACRAL